jgi:hypothetical protein
VTPVADGFLPRAFQPESLRTEIIAVKWEAAKMVVLKIPNYIFFLDLAVECAALKLFLILADAIE